MVPLELIAKTALQFSQPPTLAAIVMVGFLSINENIYGKALFLALFTMIYSLFLKSIWQVPLPLPLEGWAFPSGHMHTAVVFWGWLAYEYKKFWFTALVVFLLCLVGYGLVYQGFHYPVDVLGGLGFGSLSLIIFSFLHRLSFFKKSPYCLGWLLASIGMVLILLIPNEFRKITHLASLGCALGVFNRMVAII